MFFKKFERLFSINKPPKGSYYLQCKVEHAKNALHEHLLSPTDNEDIETMTHSNNNTQNTQTQNQNNQTNHKNNGDTKS